MLPKIENPLYEATLPISNQKVMFRPFLVKEQKILLLAKQSEDAEFALNNIKQIIKNCCVSDIDVNKLTQIDIEYFFLQLRARSIGEIVETKYRCNNKIDENVCGNLMPVSINLLEVSIDKKENNDIIQLTDSVGFKMKYPDIAELSKLDDQITDAVTLTLEVIYNSLDYIFDEQNFYYKNETPKSEVLEFLESMSIDQYKKVEEFFSNLPVLKETLTVKCSKCGFVHNIDIVGLDNFLG